MNLRATDLTLLLSAQILPAAKWIEWLNVAVNSPMFCKLFRVNVNEFSRGIRDRLE